MKIKDDITLMKFISLFEYVTYAKVKDCFIDKQMGDLLTFVVQPGQMGKAVGKGAVNVKNIEQKLKRKIRVIEYHPELVGLIKNMIMPLKADRVEHLDGVVTIRSNDTKIKGLLIGRNAANLRNLEENVRRYFEVKEIKVV